MVDTQIPDEFVQLARDWHGGQSSMLYAVCSTGGLTRGTDRPRHDDGRPLTDEEWLVDLWGQLEAELRGLLRVLQPGTRGLGALRRFLRYAESTAERLRSEDEVIKEPTDAVPDCE